MTAVIELDKAYREAKEDPSFQAELDDLLKNYVGRETPLYHAKRLTAHIGGAQIYLKREDLNHTGAHKINNALGQVLLAKRINRNGPCMSIRPVPLAIRPAWRRCWPSARGLWPMPSATRT